MCLEVVIWWFYIHLCKVHTLFPAMKNWFWIFFACLLSVGLIGAMEHPSLTCFQCSESIAGGLDWLVKHFRHVHGLTVTGTRSENFVCGQGSCLRDFERIRSFRKHILQCHYPEHWRVRNDNQGGDNQGVGHEGSGDERGEPMDVDDEVNIHLPAPDDEAVSQAFDLRSLCLNLIAQLRSKTNVTGVVLNTVLEEIDSLLKDVTSNLKDELHKFLVTKNLLDDDEAQNLLKSFNLETPYGQLNTVEKQVNAIKEAFGLVEPIEVPLGTRVDTRLDKESGSYTQKQVYETCQYVPIIDVLKLLLSNQTVRDAIKSEKPSPNGLISSFIDGHQYKSNPFYHDGDYVLRLQLYYDELEIVNPLGSKTGVHKIGVFYYTIKNLPKHVNSSLDSIHVLAIFYDVDRKKYGFKKILGPFLNDLKKLETIGVTLKVDGEEVVFKATIEGFSGDGLAVHELFELLGPSANKFCRMCLITRDDLKNGRFGSGPMRTQAVYENHLALLLARGGSREVMSETGLVGDCALHSFIIFHITRNYIFDIMHDILEGIGPFELKLVLYQYIYVDKLFTVQYFNERARTFNYGLTEVKNKPSANFSSATFANMDDHKLKQRAMQTWLLLRAFPFLVADKVPSGDKYMNLILLLLRIMEIVFSPKVHLSTLPYLDELIKEHHEAFLSLFPGYNMINKHHHLVHYPECIRQCGPLRESWCMRYEGKHNTLKKHAQVVCNFKNSPKTLVRICQFIQSNAYGRNRFKLNQMSGATGDSTVIENILSREDLVALGYPVTKSVFKAKSLTYNGVLYRLKMVVALQSGTGREDSLPLFGRIVEIVVINSLIFLKTKVFESLSLDPDLNAYRVAMRENHEFLFVRVSSLADPKPVSLWKLFNPDRTFVSLRHILV